MPVLAAHIIATAYGFWLPNDPRGSWSDFVASWELLRFGRATKVNTRASVAHVAHNRQRRLAAKQALKYKPVRLNGAQARAVGRGFAQAVAEGNYTIHACSVLHEHVHLVVAAHDRPFERITAHLKARATQQLRAEGLHPFQHHAGPGESVPTPWAQGLWKVYCFDTDHVGNAIRYVEQNPAREGERPQRWRFVIPFDLR